MQQMDWIVLAMLIAAPVRADEQLFKERIAPILRKRCLECHNPQKSRGGLDLSSRAAMLQGGDQGTALVLGKSGESLLVTMVTGPKPEMPRKGSPLIAAEVAILRRWIDGGAAWPKEITSLEADTRVVVDGSWWSLRPLTRPPLPAIKQRDGIRTPIDQFLVAALESKGLQYAPEADRRTLVRRLYFDLHGLPPTPEETTLALDDTSAEWYEKLVDRLLASPRYGERWGRHWLDVVHFADTHGYDKDKRRDHAWPYRDYVIRAFNEDKLYSQFVREQLAGDALAPNDPQGIVATGFLAAGPWDFVGHVELREGTVDKLKTRLIDRDDMLSNAMSSFVSMTVHCARCHDHKFDPIPQQDYYRLQAVFAGIDRGDRDYQSASTPEWQRLEVRKKDLRAMQTSLQKRIDLVADPRLKKHDETLRLLCAELAALPKPAGKGPSPSNGWHSGITATPDITKWVQLDLGESLPLEEVRLLPARPTDFRDSPGFGFPVRYQLALADDSTFARADIVIDQAAADVANPGDQPVRVALKGKKARYLRVTALRLWKRENDYCFALAELQAYSQGKNVALGKTVTSLDSIEAGRWSRKFLVDDCDSRQRLADDAALEKRRQIENRIGREEETRLILLDMLLDAHTRTSMRETARELAQIEKQLSELTRPAKVYTVLPRSAKPIHLLARGDVEKPGKEIHAGALSCVSALPHEFTLDKPDDEGRRRAALAEWIVSPKNPLTWRSIANRVWHYHFGKGIVDTPNDFGANGGRPSHPELLDWLACEIRDHVSIKQLHRVIVCSRAYRQASRHDEAAAKIDAENRLLWRMNRLRLDAESIRDSVLAVSGKLDLTMGGPGYDLFRFKDDHSPIYDHTALERIHDPKTYRRTIYRFTVRSVPNPFLDCLDCADPNINTPVRNTTLTALQALSLLNNPFIVKQAEFFAERLKKASPEVERQIEEAYRLAFARLPSSEERTLLAEYARKHGLTGACRLLFNANEFVFVD